MLNPDLIAKVAQKLDPLGLNYAFVGGSIVEFLLDRPDLSPMRPTDDLDVIVDVMPTEGSLLGLNTAWFSAALATAKPRRILGVDVPLISAVAFLATKLTAFADRGDGDYYGSTI